MIIEEFCTIKCLIINDRCNYLRKIKSFRKTDFRGGGGAHPARAPPKIGKNKIFWRKIVIFHTKYPKIFRASLGSAQFFLSAPPLTCNPGSAPAIVLRDLNPRPQAVLFNRRIPSVFHKTLSKYTPNNSFIMRFLYMSRAKYVHFLVCKLPN